MSHRERKIQERKTREAKIEEQIKNGTITWLTEAIYTSFDNGCGLMVEFQPL